MAYQSLHDSLAAPIAAQNAATEAIKRYLEACPFIQQQNAALNRAAGKIEGIQEALRVLLSTLGVPDGAEIRIEFDNGSPVLVANTEVPKQQ